MRIALAMLAVVAGCADAELDGGNGPADDSVTVTLTCETDDPEVPCVFQPAEVRVRAGGSVRWLNADATFHTVTSSDSAEVRRPNGVFDAVLDTPGEESTRTFTQPGRFPYYCQPHAEFMAGTVTVVAE